MSTLVDLLLPVLDGKDAPGLGELLCESVLPGVDVAFGVEGGEFGLAHVDVQSSAVILLIFEIERLFPIPREDIQDPLCIVLDVGDSLLVVLGDLQVDLTGVHDSLNIQHPTLIIASSLNTLCAISSTSLAPLSPDITYLNSGISNSFLNE